MTDVLVVGGGLAAMAAAIEAAEAGAEVTMAWAGSGSSELAQGGVAAALGAGDSPALHAADTVAAGAGLCDEAAVNVLTAEAPGTVAWLGARGVAFDRHGDALALGLEAAHSRPRIVHCGGDESGAAIVAALRRSLPARGAALEGARLSGLLVAPGGVAGGRLEIGGVTRDVRAGATILATGGYAGLFPRSTTTPMCDGSALLAALAAGAELADLELVQFHPTVYAGPGRPFLLTEALRGAGAHLVDGDGHRFVPELASRAVIARALAERDEAPTFLDARHVGLAGFPGFVSRCRAVGLDPRVDLVPIAPAAHYTMGGIVTDLCGHTRAPGLLAAGECARTGVHGANRLASNSLLEAVVLGRRAGRAARPVPAPGRVRALEPASAAPTARERSALGRAAGPLRDAASLRAALDEVRPDSLAALVIASALAREESRGAHVRTDHPREEERWAELEVAVGVSGRPAGRQRRRTAPSTAPRS